MAALRRTTSHGTVLLTVIMGLWSPQVRADPSEVLPPAFRQALDTAQPGWQLAPVSDRLRQRHHATPTAPVPNVVAGDFDGNGHQDWAVLVVFTDREGRRRDQLIVLLQSDERVRAIRADDPGEADPNRSLKGRARGAKLMDLNTQREFVATHDAIEVDYDCCGCATYVFDGARFQGYWTCD